jgi:hypothetical protein
MRITSGLFHAALEREPEARQQFIDVACGGDTDLRGEMTCGTVREPGLKSEFTHPCPNFLVLIPQGPPEVPPVRAAGLFNRVSSVITLSSTPAASHTRCLIARCTRRIWLAI